MQSNFTHSAKYKFFVEIYLTSDDCKDYVYVKTITYQFIQDKSDVSDSDIPDQCLNQNYNLTIKNLILIQYTVPKSCIKLY